MISKSHLGSQFCIQNELSSWHRTSSNAEECCKKAAIICIQSSLAATSNKWLRELLKQTVLLTLNIVYIVFVSVFILHISMVCFFVSLFVFMNLSIPLLNSCNFFSIYNGHCQGISKLACTWEKKSLSCLRSEAIKSIPDFSKHPVVIARQET